MVSCPIMGPKCAVYWMVISVWGFVMLGLMAVFFRIRSPNLLVDALNKNIKTWKEHNYDTQYVLDLYNTCAINCAIAACLYSVLFAFAIIQFRLNNPARVTA